MSEGRIIARTPEIHSQIVRWLAHVTSGFNNVISVLMDGLWMALLAFQRYFYTYMRLHTSDFSKIEPKIDHSFDGMSTCTLARPTRSE